jgi:CheY-like chemotaxis protein
MSAPSQRPLDGLTILVVDDHRDTVDMLQKYLTASGATVVGAGSAKAALAVTETRALDAVLIDLRMPGADGGWFLRQLTGSRMAAHAQIPVYALSGEHHDQPEPASGFAGYFLKPINLDAVVAALQTLPRRSGR